MLLEPDTYDRRVSRVLLLLPHATYRAPDFLAAARALGAEVVATSDRRHAMSDMMGDRALTVNLNRVEEAVERIVDRARKKPLDAVVGVDDQGVLVAAMAQARLGLPHNPSWAVRASMDKILMREAFADAGIPQPEFRVAGPDEDVAELAGQVGFPCVIKPVSLSASRGVIRANNPAEAGAAAGRIRKILEEAGRKQDEPLLAESYMPGIEVAVEGLLRDGELEILAVFDKPDPLEGPYFQETIYVTPSRLPAAQLEAVRALSADAAAALGLVEGPVHAEMRLDDGEARMLELASRSIGGLCGRSLRFGTDGTLEEVILRHALGRPLDDLAREDEASGVMMLPVPKSGRLVEVRGQDEARAVSGVTELEISIGPGRPVKTLPETDRYLGFLFARGETPAGVEQTLREAYGRLDVVIEESPDPDGPAGGPRELPSLS